jgi:hypothetical protein
MTPEHREIIQKLAQIGDVVYVKKDGSRIDLNEKGSISLQTQTDAVLYFFQRLDIAMLKSVLDDEHTYQDYEKRVFLKKLDNAFDDLLKSGNTFLNRYEGFCNSEECNFKCKGYSFVGNVTNDYMDFIFDIRDNRVFDMYECSHFKCNSELILKNKNIALDSEMPF